MSPTWLNRVAERVWLHKSESNEVFVSSLCPEVRDQCLLTAATWCGVGSVLCKAEELCIVWGDRLCAWNVSIRSLSFPLSALPPCLHVFLDTFASRSCRTLCKGKHGFLNTLGTVEQKKSPEICCTCGKWLHVQSSRDLKRTRCG